MNGGHGRLENQKLSIPRKPQLGDHLLTPDNEQYRSLLTLGRNQVDLPGATPAGKSSFRVRHNTGSIRFTASAWDR